MAITQDELMLHDPATGYGQPYPSHAGQWRAYHGTVAWLWNPWTGKLRDARDIGSDVHGHLIVPPSEQNQRECQQEMAVDAIAKLKVQECLGMSRQQFNAAKGIFPGMPEAPR